VHATQEKNRLYRDGQGRTRHESGSVVTISDPVAGTTVRMDTRGGTYTKTLAPQKPAGIDSPARTIRLSSRCFDASQPKVHALAALLPDSESHRCSSPGIRGRGKLRLCGWGTGIVRLGHRLVGSRRG
jgi:hypothetical protein